MSPDPNDVQLRPATAEEFPALWKAAFDIFGETAHDEDRAVEVKFFEPARSLIGLSDGEIVATTYLQSRELTVPGGPTPIAGVTFVAVAPTHRRQGLLTAMIERQFADLHSGAEPIAVLWASESVIYQRFGYGLAAYRARHTGHTREMAFRPEVDTGAGRVRYLDAPTGRRVAQEIYAVQRPTAVGHLSRSEALWDYRLHDAAVHRDGATEARAVGYVEPSGEITGVAYYRRKSEAAGNAPDDMLTVLDVQSLTPAGYAALWRFLLDLDLVRRMQRRLGGVDEPLRHLLADPRALTTELTDSLWVRLVDVDRALAARSYSTDVSLVLDVTDGRCPWNARRWRLDGGPDGATCTATSAPADLSLSSTELGAAYLGGTTLTSLAAAGRIVEQTPGALARATTAFGWPVVPWCPEVF